MSARIESRNGEPHAAIDLPDGGTAYALLHAGETPAQAFQRSYRSWSRMHAEARNQADRMRAALAACKGTPGVLTIMGLKPDDYSNPATHWANMTYARQYVAELIASAEDAASVLLSSEYETDKEYGESLHAALAACKGTQA